MRISDILSKKQPTISFEVFPPKAEDQMDKVTAAAEEIAALGPDFMSVTYGAGGGTSRYTVEIASGLARRCGVTAIAHLTCVTSTREKVTEVLGALQREGIENVLALRGDIPADGAVEHDYRYASELSREIRGMAPGLCIGAACYPEGHVEAPNKTEDLRHLKEKVEAGVDFLTTQMFFDNNILYQFLYRLRDMGVQTPVLAGIMPITNRTQVKRTVAMSGTQLPERFKNMVDRFGDNPAAMEQAGVLYAAEQIVDLIANRVNGIHVYTMNKPRVAAKIMDAVSVLLS